MDDQVTRTFRTEHGHQTVTIIRGPGQTDEGMAADLDASMALGENMLAEGVRSWRSYLRRLGPVKMCVAKEVGPPPWRFPQVHVSPGTVWCICAGWRSTAYYLFVARS